MKSRPNWRAKLHPVFFELAQVNRALEKRLNRIEEECNRRLKNLRDTPDPKAKDAIAILYYSNAEKLSTVIDKKLVEINRRYPDLSYNPLAYSYFDLSGEPADNLIPYLHWMRHRESFGATAADDSRGNIKARRKIARTGEDYRRIVHRKGPIKPFLGDTVHRQLLELMLCFELKPLTAEQRADCADAYCACGKTHDPDAIKKQLGRLRKELQYSAELAPPEAPSPPKYPARRNSKTSRKLRKGPRKGV